MPVVSCRIQWWIWRHQRRTFRVDKIECILHGHEKVIDVPENTIGRSTLIVMFETHTEHIEENTKHDENVELLVGSQIKEESGDGKLER